MQVTHRFCFNKSSAEAYGNFVLRAARLKVSWHSHAGKTQDTWVSRLPIPCSHVDEDNTLRQQVSNSYFEGTPSREAKAEVKEGAKTGRNALLLQVTRSLHTH